MLTYTAADIKNSLLFKLAQTNLKIKNIDTFFTDDSFFFDGSVLYHANYTFHTRLGYSSITNSTISFEILSSDNTFYKLSEIAVDSDIEIDFIIDFYIETIITIKERIGFISLLEFKKSIPASLIRKYQIDNLLNKKDDE